MRFRLPTIDIKLGSREVDVQTPDANGARRDLADLDLRGRASELRDVAASGASTLRDAAADTASSIRGMASDRAADLKDRAPEVKLPDVKLPSVDLPAIDIPKAVAPAAKAVGEGIEAVAESFRSIGRGINDWRKPPKPQPPYAEAGVALLAGVGGGMALMFFLDPKQGHRRRTLLAAKLTRWTRSASRALQGTGRDLAGRSQALTSAVASMGRGAEDKWDADTQTAVLGGPDASSDLEAIDRAVGREPGGPFTGAGDDLAPAAYSDYSDASTGASAASSEILGQAWGETSSGTSETSPGTSDEVGSFADSVTPAEDRDRIGSA